MHSRKYRIPIYLPAYIFLLVSSATHAQQTTQRSTTPDALTVERIFSEPSLSGHALRAIAWTPDGKRVSFLEARTPPVDTPAVAARNEHEPKPKPKKEINADLWIVDCASGDRRVLVSGDRLTSMLPENSSAPTQATGLGRHAPPDYQWAPDGSALLFQGPTALVWFDLKSQSPRTLVAGKAVSPTQRFRRTVSL